MLLKLPLLFEEMSVRSLFFIEEIIFDWPIRNDSHRPVPPAVIFFFFFFFRKNSKEQNQSKDNLESLTRTHVENC